MEELLKEIFDLEQKAHELWNNSFTNLVFCNPSEEQREKLIQDTYEATRLHSEAMDKTRILLQLLDASSAQLHHCSISTIKQSFSISCSDVEAFRKAVDQILSANIRRCYQFS